MRFYLTARYSRHSEMQAYAGSLSALGHEVGSRWHRRDYEASKDIESELEFSRRLADEDYYDLSYSDAIIAFTEGPDTPGRGRGGRHVEFGIALQASKTCIVIGPAENIFYTLSQVYQFDTWEEFKEALEGGTFNRG